MTLAVPVGPLTLEVTPPPPLAPVVFEMEIEPGAQARREVVFERGGRLRFQGRSRPAVRRGGRTLRPQFERTRAGREALLPPGDYDVVAGGKTFAIVIEPGETTVVETGRSAPLPRRRFFGLIAAEKKSAAPDSCPSLDVVC